MIEQLLKKRGETFCYGEITAVNTVDRKFQVRRGETNVWILTELDLDIGDTVILARFIKIYCPIFPEITSGRGGFVAGLTG